MSDVCAAKICFFFLSLFCDNVLLKSAFIALPRSVIFLNFRSAL